MDYTPINRACSIKEVRDAYGWDYILWRDRISRLPVDLGLFFRQKVLSIVQVNIIIAHYGRPDSLKD